jgi:serine/threonine protein kinase
MASASPPTLHPALLPPGAVVGAWRVVAWGGHGVYGAVYRAVRVEEGDEQARPVALKLALLPKDPRFAREVELLSRSRHPSIPRLVDSGEWQHPSGTTHPYIVMEWIDGAPLYEWVRQHNPHSQQVFRLLAQLAGALQAVHAQGAVHRDVKGDNLLVRRSDSRAILTDFGSGFPPDAALLTPQSLIPGTPAYHSPEAELFPLRIGRNATARYSAGPADDLYALGVTAYRLVTGQYPQHGEPFTDDTGTWQPGELGSPPPHVLNPRMDPRLSALILRMLSVRPDARGTAAQLVEALEQAAHRLVPESTQPLFEHAAMQPSAGPIEAANAAPAPDPSHRLSGRTHVRISEPQERTSMAQAEGRAPEAPSRGRGSTEFAKPRVHVRPWLPLLAMTAAGLALVAWAWWAAPWKFVEKPSVAQQEAGGAGQQDAGTTGLGDEASTASTEDSVGPSGREIMAEDTLPEPLPGQARPDEKGRCRHKRQVALNGGCWVVLSFNREECEENGGYVFKTKCYLPFFPHGRPSTSNPTHKP